jgi:uncharacterized FlaG/YvyC family protein
MSENILSSVGSIGNVESSRPAMVQASSSASALDKAQSVAHSSSQVNGPEQGQDAKLEVKADEASSNKLSNIRLKFRVNDETNEITILVLDQASKEVIRTIPADEMAKMHPGDLLNLFA